MTSPRPIPPKRPWNPEWSKHGLKWLTCPRCLCELDFLIPVDTAKEFNIIKAQSVLEEHHDDCPGIG